MNKLFLSVLAMISFITMHGQKYNTTGGIRVGDDFGISVVQRIADKSTIDLTYQPGTFAGNRLLLLTANQHYPLLSKRFNFFIGGGYYYKSHEDVFQTQSQTDVITQPDAFSGIAFNLGAELTIGRLTLAADYVPLVHFGQNTYRRFYSTSGLSLRYVFVERESKTKKFFKNIFKKKKKK